MLSAQIRIMIGGIICNILTKPVKRKKCFRCLFVRELYFSDDQRGEGGFEDVQFYRQTKLVNRILSG